MPLQSISIDDMVKARELCLHATEGLLNSIQNQEESELRGRLLHEAAFLLTDFPEDKQANHDALERAIKFYLTAKVLRNGSDKAMTSSRIIRVATDLNNLNLALDEAIEAADYYLQHKDLERIAFLKTDIDYMLGKISTNKAKYAKKIEQLKKMMSRYSSLKL